MQTRSRTADETGMSDLNQIDNAWTEEVRRAHDETARLIDASRRLVAASDAALARVEASVAKTRSLRTEARVAELNRRRRRFVLA